MNVSKSIPGFPGYYANSDGFITSEAKGGVILGEYYNQLGYIYVVMVDENGARKVRQVNQLICRAFKEPMDDHFTHVIHLDHNKDNCSADNLEWRPKWFTVRYNRQHRNNAPEYSGPIELVETGEVFPNITIAASKLGLLEYEIYRKLDTDLLVFPIDVTFRHAS